MSKLAIHGGNPVCEKQIDATVYRPLRFGQAEKDALARVVDTGALCRIFGRETEKLEQEFARYFGAGFGVASSSCTASIHSALAAVGVGWQDEVITSPVTDMGTVIGIVAQGAVPVFADIDERTYNITPGGVEKAISARTKAILAVHLAGLCCDMEAIGGIAHSHGIPLIEDCAQSYLASRGGKLAGTFGDIGTFSLNGFKHIESGDGGMCITGDPDLERRMRIFVDKAYDRKSPVRNPSVFAMNYRMTELQAAVARVQLGKLAAIVERRREIVGEICGALAGVPGLILPYVPEGCGHSWWFMAIRADRPLVKVSTGELVDALCAEGLPAWTDYQGGLPVYLYDCFVDPSMAFFRPPFLAQDKRPLAERYPRGICPVAERMLKEIIILVINEFYSDREVGEIIEGLGKVFSHYAA